MKERRFDFGWSRAAYAGPWIFAAVLIGAALGLQLARPDLWSAWFAVALVAVNSFVVGSSCAPPTGRTTLSIVKVLRRGRIVAFDRFDAWYIDGGGRALLERNLRIAGLPGRVEVVTGDLTRMPFPDAHFDSAVSAHVIDHLKQHKKTALAEIRRVLKPGMYATTEGCSLNSISALGIARLSQGRCHWPRVALLVAREPTSRSDPMPPQGCKVEAVLVQGKMTPLRATNLQVEEIEGTGPPGR